MRDSNSARKPGGFSGGKFKSAGASSSSRGGFSRPQGGSFTARGGSDRSESRGFRGGRDSRDSQARSFDRPMYKATCSDCGKACEVPFRPTGEKPVLCSYCFADQQGTSAPRSFAAKSNSFEAGADKKMFKAACKECGAQCEVPFRPIPGKDVLCDNCFKGGSSSKIAKINVDSKEQFEMLHAKLDKILAFLSESAKPEKKVSSSKSSAKEAAVKEVIVEADEEATKPKAVTKAKGKAPVKK
ncbi:MAG: CxxC-x17-CxxC domain-containing protein [bacterium]